MKQVSLVFRPTNTPEKLAAMSIHSEIRRRRLALNWSLERLADEVSRLEGLSKPLTWQTAQQWEKEPDGTAPKRKRLEFVAAALGTKIEHLLAGGQSPARLADALTQVGEALRGLHPERRAELAKQFALWADYPDEPDYAARMLKLLLTSPGVQAQPSALPEKRHSHGR